MSWKQSQEIKLLHHVHTIQQSLLIHYSTTYVVVCMHIYAITATKIKQNFTKTTQN